MKGKSRTKGRTGRKITALLLAFAMCMGNITPALAEEIVQVQEWEEEQPDTGEKDDIREIETPPEETDKEELDEVIEENGDEDSGDSQDGDQNEELPDINEEESPEEITDGEVLEEEPMEEPQAAAVALADETYVNVSTMEALLSAMESGIKDIRILKGIELEGDLDLDSYVEDGIAVILTAGNSNARHFVVPANVTDATLTLGDNIILDGNNRGGGIDVQVADANTAGQFTVTGGQIINCTSGASSFAGGAGIYIPISLYTLTVEDTVFENNGSLSRGHGGAIYRAGGNGDTVLDGVHFVDCYVGDNNIGGALYIASGNDVTIKDCVFTGNQGGTGGAASIRLSRSAGGMTIEDCRFTGNTAAKQGGALHTEAKVEIKKCQFTDNQQDPIATAATNGGGALYTSGTYDYYAVSVVECTFKGNGAAGYGGAVLAGCSGIAAVLQDCVFTANYAGNGGAVSGVNGVTSIDSQYHNNTAEQEGGAIYFSPARASILTLQGSNLFSENQAVENGGAMAAKTTYGNLKIEGSTVLENNAAGDSGGGIYVMNPDRKAAKLTVSGAGELHFTGNMASVMYDLDGSDIAIFQAHPAHAAAQSLSKPFDTANGDSPFNNLDISYEPEGGSGSGQVILRYEPNHTGGSPVYEVYTSGGQETLKGPDHAGLNFTHPDGYQFAGWCTEKSGKSGTWYEPGDSVNLDSSVVLYGIWADYVVVLDDGLGAENRLFFNQGDTFKVPEDPEQEGYAFKGWSLTPGGTADPVYTAGAEVALTRNLKLYGIWAKVFIVEYHWNMLSAGTTGTDMGVYTTVETVTGETSEILDFPEFSGYVGKEWTTERNGTGSVYMPGDPYADPSGGTLKLYMQWYTVKTKGTVTPAHYTQVYGGVLNRFSGFQYAINAGVYPRFLEEVTIPGSSPAQTKFNVHQYLYAYEGEPVTVSSRLYYKAEVLTQDEIDRGFILGGSLLAIGLDERPFRAKVEEIAIPYLGDYVDQDGWMIKTKPDLEQELPGQQLGNNVGDVFAYIIFDPDMMTAVAENVPDGKFYIDLYETLPDGPERFTSRNYTSGLEGEYKSYAYGTGLNVRSGNTNTNPGASGSYSFIDPEIGLTLNQELDTDDPVEIGDVVTVTLTATSPSDIGMEDVTIHMYNTEPPAAGQEQTDFKVLSNAANVKAVFETYDGRELDAEATLQSDNSILIGSWKGDRNPMRTGELKRNGTYVITFEYTVSETDIVSGRIPIYAVIDGRSPKNSYLRDTTEELLEVLATNEYPYYSDQSDYPYTGEALTVFQTAEDDDIDYLRLKTTQITYDPNGGLPSSQHVVSGLPANSRHTVLENDGAAGIGYSMENHAFIGWNIMKDGTGTAYGPGEKITVPLGGAVLYAQWRPDEYNVKYNANYGTEPDVHDDGSYPAGDAVAILPNMFTYSGYTFKGWYLNPEGTGEEYKAGETFTMPAEDVTLYAQWAKKTSPPTTGGSKYNVIYHSEYSTKTIVDGSYNSGATVTVKEGGIFTVPANVNFLGWATEEKGKVVYQAKDTFAMPSKNVHLYAVYETDDEEDMLNREDHYAYVVGYPDGTVRPSDLITREEVTTIFFRLLTDDARDHYWKQTNSFRDVEYGRWSNNAISTMANANIVSGYADGSFRPGSSITRAEVAAIAARFDSSSYSGGDLFNDIDGHWATVYINRAASIGWVSGDGDGTFRPDDYITRAEMMSLINRVLDRNPESESDLLDNMVKWPDNSTVGIWYYLDVQEATNSHYYERREGKSGTVGPEKWTSIRPVRDWAALEHKR